MVAGTSPSDRALLAQEALDAIAVAAGLKPAAIFGCGYRDDALMAVVSAVPVGCGLSIGERRGWAVEAGLPAWYAGPLREAVTAERLLVVGAAAGDQGWRQLMGENPDLDAEARGLGYPSCCVAEFHRRRLDYHLITVGMLTRQAAGDEGLMGRLARARVRPTPRGEAEVRALLQATRTVFAPFTSIAMCAACEQAPDSPARRIGTAFQRLAASVGFDMWLAGAP